MTRNCMTNRKRLPLLLTGLLTVSAVALAGCSSDDDDNAATPSKDAVEPGETVSIDYWHRLPSIEGEKSVDDLVDEWNDENPQIQVKATAMQGDAGDTYPKIAAAVQGGTGPCLAQIGNERVPDLLSSDQLLDVTEFADQYQDDYLDFAWGRSTFDGHTYGIPQDTGPLVLYYRTDLFEEHGIDVPTTWDEYRAAGEKLQEEAPDAYIGSFLPDEATWLAALMSANGASWWGIEGDSWNVNIDSPESNEVAEYWQGLIDDEIVATIPRWDPNFDKGLADGTLAATVGASWEAPLIEGSAPDTEGDWGVAQLPAWDASNPLVGQSGGSIIGVLKGCEAPAAAIEFAHWLNSNTDGLMPLGLLPATEAPADGFGTPGGLQEFFGGQDIYAEFVTANENGNPNWSWSPTSGIAMTTLQDGIGKVPTGETTLPELIPAVQKSSVDSLTDAGISVTE